MSELNEYKTLSFKTLLDTKISGVDRIEIPMIQRDYAYGRKKEEEKRRDFLEKLKSYLESEGIHELDFVYGNIEKNSTDKKLILLDGQQRITTLFLLHWFLAVVANTEDDKTYQTFKSLLLLNGESRFNYKTRPSSSAFCNALVKLEREVVHEEKKGESTIEKTIILPLENEYKEFIKSLWIGKKDLAYDCLSAKIIDDKWFHPDWRFDPTVSSMLNMLDSICDIFNDIDAKRYFDNIYNKKQISFNFFNLDNTGLTDDLYIKMNSRGKPLTTFENLKSKMLSLYDDIKDKDSIKDYLTQINSVKGNTYASFRDYFSFKVDTQWTDIFWNRALEKKIPPEKINVDKRILNFIETVCVTYRIIYLMKYRAEYKELKSREMELTSDEKETLDLLEEKIEKLSDYDNSEQINTYSEYVTILKENDYYLLSALPKLFAYFTKIQNGKFVINAPISNFYVKELEIIDNITSEKSRESKTIFFAYILYILENPNYDVTLFKNWLRIVSNIVNNSNTIRNNETSYINAIEGVYKLYNSDIYSSLVNVDVKSIDTLDQKQINEEILKIKLFESQEWKKTIEEAEVDLPYFNGHLSYALNYSNCTLENFSDSDLHDVAKKDAFNLCINKLQFVFQDKKGCNLENDLVKALLSKCNVSEKYLLELSSNYSFCKNTDRDVSWIKLLDSENSKYFTMVIEDSSFYGNDLKSALKSVYSARPDSIEKWKKIIIDNDKIEDFINSKRCIRFSDSEIDLLSGTRITGYHTELYSIDIFLKIRNEIFGKGIPVYHWSNIQPDKPYCFVKFEKNDKKYELACSTLGVTDEVVSYLIAFYEAEDVKKSCRIRRKSISIPEIYDCLLNNQTVLQEKDGMFSAVIEGKDVVDVMHSIADLISAEI